MLSVLVNTHLLMAAKARGVERYFFSSSACVYAADKQIAPDAATLKKGDAYPAMAEDGYGWEKLFSERMCRHFLEDYGLVTRVARYHNVYGPHGTWDGGREKAPAAICRKIIEAKLSGNHEIDVWGDGEQSRSFMYIDDCLKGTELIMASDHPDPINLGSDQLVTINRLVDIVEDIAGIELRRRHNLDAPQGVRGRNSDNTLIEEVLGWTPGSAPPRAGRAVERSRTLRSPRRAFPSNRAPVRRRGGPRESSDRARWRVGTRSRHPASPTRGASGRGRVPRGLRRAPGPARSPGERPPSPGPAPPPEGTRGRFRCRHATGPPRLGRRWDPRGPPARGTSPLPGGPRG